MSGDLAPWAQEIFDRFTVEFAKHKPCPTCVAATGKAEMCPAGRRLYLGMLDEVKAQAAARPGTVDDFLESLRALKAKGYSARLAADGEAVQMIRPDGSCAWSTSRGNGKPEDWARFLDGIRDMIEVIEP